MLNHQSQWQIYTKIFLTVCSDGVPLSKTVIYCVCHRVQGERGNLKFHLLIFAKLLPEWQAHLTLLSYFTTFGKKKRNVTHRNTVSKSKDRILEESQLSSTLLIWKWHNDLMKSTAKYFWGWLQELQMALFRSSYSPHPTGWLNSIKKLLFSIWDPTSDHSSISTTKRIHA